MTRVEPDEEKPTTRERLPRVSVVIPAYHSHANVGRCLDALRAQTYEDFEVVVVNSSQEETTRQIVSRHAPEASFVQSPVRLLPHAARNVGVERARGSVLVFTDPDCRAEPEWLERLVAACERSAGAAGGSIATETTNWLGVGMHLCKFPFQSRGLAPGPTRIVPTANACYARELWDRIGPFDGTLFCGDSLLSARAADAGRSPVFEPSAVVVHMGRARFVPFLRERYVRGREYAGTRLRSREAARARNLARAALTLVMLVPFLVDVVRGAPGRSDRKVFLRTLPIQIVGQLAWRLGESAAYLSAAARGVWRRAVRM